MVEAQDALVAGRGATATRSRWPTTSGTCIATWCEPQHEPTPASQENRRYLQTRREGDGTLSGSFLLTAEDSETFLTVLEPLARPTGLADQRDAGQRRADALVEVVRPRRCATPTCPTPAGTGRSQLRRPRRLGRRPTAAGTFADLVRAASLRAAARLPRRPACESEQCPAPAPVEHRCATGAWSGPQTRAASRRCCATPASPASCSHPPGRSAASKPSRDTITKTQRRALAARDHGCAARGCTRPPAFCDAHHLTHREDGGTDDLDNLVLLCRRHHVLWHQGTPAPAPPPRPLDRGHRGPTGLLTGHAEDSTATCPHRSCEWGAEGSTATDPLAI